MLPLLVCAHMDKLHPEQFDTHAVVAQHITLPSGLYTTPVPTQADAIISLMQSIRDPND